MNGEHQQSVPLQVDNPEHRRWVDLADRLCLTVPAVRRPAQLGIERLRRRSAAVQAHEHARAVPGEITAVRGYPGRARENADVARDHRVGEASRTVGLRVLEAPLDTNDFRGERWRLRRDRPIRGSIQVSLMPTRETNGVADMEPGDASRGFRNHDLVGRGRVIHTAVDHDGGSGGLGASRDQMPATSVSRPQ